MRASDNATIENAGWYVVQTKRHREALADLALREAGFETYLPMARQWPPPTVGGEIGPLFPTYVFVRLKLPDQYHAAAWKPGVKGFVTFGDTPAPLSYDAITFLKEREDLDGVIRCGNVPRHVIVTKGALKGLSAVVERRLTKTQRVVVLLELLKRPTRVEVPEQWLKSA